MENVVVAFTAVREDHDRDGNRARYRERGSRRLCPKVSTAVSNPPVPTNHQKTQSIQELTSSSWYPYTAKAPTPNVVAIAKPVSA